MGLYILVAGTFERTGNWALVEVGEGSALSVSGESLSDAPARRLILNIVNYGRIVGEYGTAVSDRLGSTLVAAIDGRTGGKFVVRSCGDDRIEIADPSYCSSKSRLNYNEDWWRSLERMISVVPLQIEGCVLVAMLQPASTDDSRMALVFQGEGGPKAEGGAHSAQGPVNQYRQDMQMTGEALAGFEVSSGLDIERWASVRWVPVRCATKYTRILLYDAVLSVQGRNGCEGSANDHLIAIERLGAERNFWALLLAQLFDDLARNPTIALCLRLTDAQAYRGSAFYKVLIDACSLDRWCAQRLVLQVGGIGTSSCRSRLVSFCEDVRRLGCRVALGQFGTGSDSIGSAVAIGADIIRLDPLFVRNPGKVFGEDAGSPLAHLIGLAGAFAGVVIADGVDYADSAELLTTLGVEWQQGMFWGAGSAHRPWRQGLSAVDCEISAFPRPSIRRSGL